MSFRSECEPKIKLEYYSRRFATRLFQQFPHWKAYTGHHVLGKPDDEAFFLDVQVPSVNPGVTQPLRIMTYPKEVIVSWVGGCHRHFDTFLTRPDGDYGAKAIEFLQDVTADRIVFGYYVKDGKPTGGGFLYTAGTELPDRLLSSQHGSIVLRSWLGEYDRELHLER